MDTPEALDVWLAERRKRWPTTERVEEKKINMEKAIAQGQLPFTSGGRGTKRRREGNPAPDHQKKKGRFNKSEVSQRKNPPTQLVSQKAEHHQMGIPIAPPLASDEGGKPHTAIQQLVGYPDDENSSGDEEAPELISSKQPVGPTVLAAAARAEPLPDSPLLEIIPGGKRNMTKSRKKEPRPMPRNPFASRPTLLQNVGGASLVSFSQVANEESSFYCLKFA